MAIIPAPTNPSVTEDTPIDETLTTAATAQDLIVPPVGKIGRQVSIINRGPGDAAIALDRVATTADTLIKNGESYSEINLEVVTKISFINVSAGKKPRLTGVLWSN